MTSQRGRSRLPHKKGSGDEDPSMIGQWKIGRTIGKGSSGRVKIARHVKTHQYAAIKIVSKTALVNSRISMNEAPAQAEKILLGIEREIVIMKLIDHPNVLNLYDVWETANELYLIMEYVEGGELFDYLVSRGRIPVQEALHYFQQIISAISYCHGFNIAHRDLKPENLLLSKSANRRNIKVADFGMAAYTDPKSMLSTSCGSPHYASPEVVEGRSYKGHISDIWSCGVILYALLVGRLPFDDENLRVLLEKVKMATYETPVDIPPTAQDLIARMLEKDVTRRITMYEIQTHPFFLSSTPSPLLLSDPQTPMLDQLSCSIDKPVQGEEEIDADIFDNLRTLWHGAPAQDIIASLLNDEKTWEKTVYHLLLKYRSKHLEHYNMDECEGDLQRPRQSLQVDMPTPSAKIEEQMENVESSENAYETSAHETKGSVHMVDSHQIDPTSPTAFVRPNAPTPQRAGGYEDVMFSERDPEMTMSTPHHVRTTHSPVAPRPPLFSTFDTETDLVASTPLRSVAVKSPGSGPLALLIPPSAADSDVPNTPIINLQEATPVRVDEVLAQTKGPSNRSSSSSPSPIPSLPGIVVPNLDNVDETVQRFFHQIVEHLNAMQLWQSTSSTRSATPEPSSSDAGTTPSPVLGPGVADKIAGERGHSEASPPPPTTPASSGGEYDPDDSRFEDATEESVLSPDVTRGPQILGLGIADYRQGFRGLRTAPHPPFWRQQQQARLPPPPGRVYSKAGYNASKNSSNAGRRVTTAEKENKGLQKDGVGINGIPVHKKSSLRRADDGRKALGDKHVQIKLPIEEVAEAKLKAKKGILPPWSTETSPALSDGSFSVPAMTTPRRSWFTNLFKFKPASYHLLSVHDAYTTREECARLLRSFGIAVLLTDSEGYGVLKCKLEELRDPAGTMAVPKAVKFRVELHLVTHAHSVSGYTTSLTMVQEKGAFSSFKLVYNRLRREWEMDTPPSTRTMSSIY